ncbi:MAG: serine protease [Chloroflexi bacterium]|nr:serine protease [Chloroflexota bacterium]
MTLLAFGDLPEAVRAQAWRLVRVAVPYDKTDGPPGAPPLRAFAFQGTGFLVLRGLIRPTAYVVTCAHILRNIRERFGEAAPLRALLSSGHARPLTVMEVDETHDLAILQAAGAVPGVKDALTDEPLGKVAGLPVFALGYTEENTAALTAGTGMAVQRGRWVSAMGGVVPGERSEALTAAALILEGMAVKPGASGSPLFAADGTILGYLKGSLPDERCLALTRERAWGLLGGY